ncbi:MbnH family di-heme enzyme [Bryobacter aggregatus]|uniref:MbnH family di-heme enzyme n=1 Tax=Bryobacter aggregatus TaxID=360054 RepID=UPI0004E25F24|nr:MbnH family di-heme enzyme [Bryobacter aggregatus]
MPNSFAILLALTLASDFDWKLPKGFPAPPVPAANPMSAAKVELGRYLFYDRRLSVNGKTSCGSCHRQELAFTDGRAQSEGTTGELHPRSSMSLVNVAYAKRLTWAHNSLDSLEEQALVPMLGEKPIELGLKGGETKLLAILRADVRYQRLFPQAFPGEADAFTLPNLTKAIASFERTIVSMRSPYDRYRWGGEASAISAAAKRGELFYFSSERGGCFQCHGGWNLGGDASSMFNTGVSDYAAPNRGLYETSQVAEDVGKFRAPSLRNIALTAPYMHDGSLKTLDDVLSHYAKGGLKNHPNKSTILRPFELTDRDRADLLAFLNSLTDEELLRDSRWSDPLPPR